MAAKAIDPREIFATGAAFLRAGERLHPIIATDIPLAFPVSVIEVFSLEVFLKCLHFLNAGALPKERKHDIFELHKDLPTADKMRIATLYDQIAKASPNFQMASQQHGLPTDVDSALARCATAFVTYRYIYEDLPQSADSSGFSGPAGAWQLARACHAYILERRPDFANVKA